MTNQDSGLPNESVCGGTPDDAPAPDRDLVRALEALLKWAVEANSRLRYEQTDEYQFGGNPYLNPVFKAALAAQEARSV